MSGRDGRKNRVAYRFCGLLFPDSIRHGVENARYCEWEGDVKVIHGTWTCGGCRRVHS
jgi:hypothetical protein